jgi:hypothetical protein
MRKNVTSQILFSMVVGLVSLAATACSTDDATKTASSVSADTESCTPGQKTCDYGCYAQGGPTTNDCIVQCNAAGDGWITLQDCGWAQNLPFSSSCLDSQPNPICQNN